MYLRIRTCLTPTFSAAKMKKMSGIMGSTINTMINLLEEKIDDESGNVNVNDVYQRLTLDTIGNKEFEFDKLSLTCQSIIHLKKISVGFTFFYEVSSLNLSCGCIMYILYVQILKMENPFKTRKFE